MSDQEHSVIDKLRSDLCGRRLLKSAGAAFVCVFCGALLLLSTIAPSAWATVTVDGNVLLTPLAPVPLDPPAATFYGDDPFTTKEEGIPGAGNVIEGFRLMQQVKYEGRWDDKNTVDTSDDDNINFSIVVGRTSIGQLFILGASKLRDEDLIIGDSGMVNGQMRRGTGIVRIDSNGSLFNNDPTIIPFFPGQDPENPVSPSKTPRSKTVGFDVYVGRNGTGQLEVGAGARMEVQDAFIIGDQTGSVGSAVFDGLDSAVQSGLFLTTPSTGGNFDPHEAYVGRLGSGTLTIRNGAQMTSFGPDISQPTEQVVAAVIGSNRFADGDAIPENAGVGVATVDGTASKWTIGGTFQIGGFHNSEDPMATTFNNEDLSGVFAQYGPGVGHGTLYVSNGGLVSVVTPPLENVTQTPVALDIWVGRFGKIQLATGGRIELNGVLDNTSGGNPIPQMARGRLINDGVIGGSGSISVLQFRNRVLGEVRVGAGEKLYVAATGQFDPLNTSPPDELPFSNYGLIEALGTSQARAEIEFDRGPNIPSTPPVATQPFFNLPAAALGQNGRSGGVIVGQDATFRFRSGIDNQASVLFTGGTNIVSGEFVNNGLLLVSGDNTTVTFEDGLTNNGLFQLAPNISLVTVLQNIVLGGGGSLSTSVGGRPTGQEINHLSIGGSMFLDGLLDVGQFTAPGVPAFSPEIGDVFEIMGSSGPRVGTFSGFLLPFLGVDRFYTVDYGANFVNLRVVGFNAGTVVGADLNGDGVVNASDLLIWQLNLGHPGGPGDINHDGIVNGLDFLIWQQQVGGPPIPIPGGGAGANLGTGAVPEPASFAMLVIGGLLALASQRRRARI